MNTMRMPGFTAETSLYQHTTSYRVMAGSNGMAQGRGNAVSPAFWARLCRAGCWAAGAALASACTVATVGGGVGACAFAAGAAASICSDSC